MKKPGRRESYPRCQIRRLRVRVFLGCWARWPPLGLGERLQHVVYSPPLPLAVSRWIPRSAWRGEYPSRRFRVPECERALVPDKRAEWYAQQPMVPSWLVASSCIPSVCLPDTHLNMRFHQQIQGSEGRGICGKQVHEGHRTTTQTYPKKRSPYPRPSCRLYGHIFQKKRLTSKSCSPACFKNVGWWSCHVLCSRRLTKTEMDLPLLCLRMRYASRDGLHRSGHG